MLSILLEQLVQAALEKIVIDKKINHENAKSAVKHVVRVVDLITTAVEIAAHCTK